MIRSVGHAVIDRHGGLKRLVLVSCGVPVFLLEDWAARMLIGVLFDAGAPFRSCGWVCR